MVTTALKRHSIFRRCVSSVLYAPRRLNPRGGPCLSYSSSRPLPRAISRRVLGGRRRTQRERKGRKAALSFSSAAVAFRPASLRTSVSLSLSPSSLRVALWSFCPRLSSATSKPPNSLAIRSSVYSRHCETKAAPYLFRALSLTNSRFYHHPPSSFVTVRPSVRSVPLDCDARGILRRTQRALKIRPIQRGVAQGQ